MLELCSKIFLGFAEHQKNDTHSLGFQLTLTRIKDVAVFQKAVALADARIKIDHIHWYVAHYTKSIQQQSIMSKQILKNTPTERRYFERFVFRKK